MNNGGGPDLHLVAHELNRKLAHITSELVEKDQSDKAQIRLILQTVGRFVGVQVKPLQKQIEELKARLEEIEKRGVDFRGIYQRSCEYRRGSLVSHDHSVWACIEDAAVNKSPAAFPSRWQMVLRGDGRDTPRQGTRGGARPETTVQRRT